MVGTVVKHPNARLDYTLDWSAWLPSGDTITDATWTEATGDLVITNETNTTTTATAYIAGGTEGTTYAVGCRITTAAGRIDERTITLKVKTI